MWRASFGPETSETNAPTIEAALEAGRRFNLKNWVLFPTRDEHVAAFSRNRCELAEIFRLTTPVSETTKWAWDKNLSYELAGKLGIPILRLFRFSGHLLKGDYYVHSDGRNLRKGAGAPAGDCADAGTTKRPSLN